jgi:hypothetical protein
LWGQGFGPAAGLLPGALLAIALLGSAIAAKEPGTPNTAIAKLASYISDGEPIGALEAFDKSMLRYQAIAENLQALAAQTEVLCSIDIVEDKEADDAKSDVHHLDLDWYMTLKPRADNALIEKRRQRVAVTLKRFTTKSGEVWRITQLSPEQILAPITIK